MMPRACDKCITSCGLPTGFSENVIRLISTILVTYDVPKDSTFMNQF